MAAQPIVRRSFVDPIETYSTNLLGTVNLLHALTTQEGVKAILVVTSDKVYLNTRQGGPFNEDAPFGGNDPYSSSKAACELAVKSFSESFFRARKVAIATARAGNVIGGGDWGIDRLIPDIVRSQRRGKTIRLRYPDARRPWQHVLDCVGGYLAYIQYIYGKPVAEPPALNFGPPVSEPQMTVAELTDEMLGRLSPGSSPAWLLDERPMPTEKKFLALETSKAREVLGWTHKLDTKSAIDWTADWYKAFSEGGDAYTLLQMQIDRFLAESA
jgi:CDP-glucose 4,6-dehydratase